MAVATVEVHRWTREEYERLAAAGFFPPEARVELVEGMIYDMAPIGSRHAASVRRVNGLFSRVFWDRALADIQNPVRLGDFSEPQPDLSLLRPRDDFYSQAHPGPSDVFLLVEVADTSVEYDRAVKLPLYARNAIPEVWLIDLTQSHLEVHREPADGAYTRVQVLRPGERVSPEAFPEVVFEVARLLS